MTQTLIAQALADDGDLHTVIRTEDMDYPLAAAECTCGWKLWGYSRDAVIRWKVRRHIEAVAPNDATACTGDYWN